MRLFGFEIGRAAPAAAESRTSPESPTWSISDADAWRDILAAWNSTAGPVVTTETALGVPAVWAAVNFLANLLASLPFQEFKRAADGGRERVTAGMIAGMLGGTVNDDLLTSHRWRKQAMISALTTGAGRTWIEKDAAGRPVNLWPLETARTTVKREAGRTLYKYRLSSGKTITYEAAEVIDIVFMPALDGVSVFNPVQRMRDTIGLAIALEQYAARFFANGGVPPLALKGAMGSPQAVARAKADIGETVRKANKAGDPILAVPDGYELVPVAFDPEKGQLIEAQKFVIVQIARLYGLPPVFLQDLTFGTFTNSEQQDLHLSKHTATAWVRQWEDECNAKLYGPRQASRYVAFNLDGLQRGDFKTRTEGVARAIQTGQLTPNEARALDNREAMEGGDVLLIQGATVPLTQAGKTPTAPAAPAADPTDPQEDPADAP